MLSDEDMLMMKISKDVRLDRELKGRKTDCFYLAGPFFNPAQVELIRKIEVAFCDAGVAFFSPRLTGENAKKVLTDEDAAAIYGNNLIGMESCSHMLAVLDWVMPESKKIFVCDLKDLGGEIQGCTNYAVPVGNALNIPDAGTVFEMGYYAANNRPIYIYTERPPEAAMNVMLTQCSRGVIRGQEMLKMFLNRGQIDWSQAVRYSGRHS